MNDSPSKPARSRGHAGPGSRTRDAEVSRPSFAERARTLLCRQTTGFLSTHSRHQAGFPFGSVMPFAVEEAGSALFLISKMAMHTQNLDQDPRASLLVPDPGVSTNPLGSARVTLLGRAEAVPEDGIETARGSYLAAHESARYWVDYADFGFYRLQVESLYYVGGFGEMGWVEVEEYGLARPDPLLDSAAHIVSHMNEDHADALILLAGSFAEIEAESAEMTAVDRLGFHLRVRADDRMQGCRIAFPSEVVSPEEVRMVMVEMVRKARTARPARSGADG